MGNTQARRPGCSNAAPVHPGHALRLRTTLQTRIATHGRAVFVNHTDMVELSLPGPVDNVIAQEGPRQGPEGGSPQGGLDRILRTLHLAVQPVTTPYRPPVRFLSNVVCRTRTGAHAQAAGGTPIGVPFEQSAVDVLHQPSAGEPPIESIHERRLGLLLRVQELLGDHAPGDCAVECRGARAPVKTGDRAKTGTLPASDPGNMHRRSSENRRRSWCPAAQAGIRAHSRCRTRDCHAPGNRMPACRRSAAGSSGNRQR